MAEETAVVMDGERISPIGQLERQSNRLARLLGENGASRRATGSCLLQPKSPQAIVSILATLKAGGVYVPIDVSSPAARVQKIVDMAEPRIS